MELNMESARSIIANSQELAIDDDALNVAHLAVEDELIDLRNRGIFVLMHNGFVVNSFDGEPSCVMRMGTRDGLRVAIRAYLKTIEAKESGN